MVQAESQVRRAVGALLLERRAALGWTLQEVAQRAAREGAHISLATLHRLERGQSRLPFFAVAALCRSLGASLSELEAVLHFHTFESDSQLGARSCQDWLDEGFRQRAIGDYPRALEAFDAAVARARAEENADGLNQRLAEALIHKGDCHLRLRHFRACLDCAWQVLNLEGTTAESRLRAMLLHVEVGYSTGEFGRAELFAQHLAPLLKSAAPWTQAYANAVIGTMYFKLDRFADAIKPLETSRKLYGDAGLTIEVARAGVTLGYCHHRVGRPQSGRRFVEESYQLALTHQHLQVVAYALRTLARLCADENAVPAALDHYEAAVDISRRLGLDHEVFVARYAQWRLHQAAGDQAAADRTAASLKRMLKRVDPRLAEVKAFVAAGVSGRGPRGDHWCPRGD